MTPETQKRSTAAVLLIGNEILSGRTTDKNLAVFGTGLSAHGIRLVEARVVEDVPAAIIDAVRTLSAQYDYLFTTGGIGPTHDDITAECIAQAFGVELQQHPEAVRRLQDFCERRGVPLTEDRLRMARVPAGATLIDNDVSAAPGFQLQNVYVMAGVPLIMQSMFEKVLPTLDRGAPILSVNVGTNLAEGEYASALARIQEAWPEVAIGSYPGHVPGGRGGMLVARSEDAEALEQVREQLCAMVLAAGGRLLEPD